MKYLMIIALLFSAPAIADTTANCMQRANYVQYDSTTLWNFVKVYEPSAAKDSVFSFQDFAVMYYGMMRRMPGREDRTRGIYLELRDKFRYMYDRASRYPWRSTAVWNTLELINRDMAYLSQCYPGVTDDE